MTASPASTPAAAQADFLAACEREPIRIPGAIQPHGALILLARPDLRVLQASANFGVVVGPDAEGSCGRPIAELRWGSDTFCRELAQWCEGPEPLYLRSHRLGQQAFTVSAHRSPQGIVVEFEPADDRVPPPAALYPMLRRFLERTERLADVGELSDRVAEQVAGLTGFNRVMVYRFDEDWNGTVIAERGDGVLPTYLDLRFPAFDIPAQARELYRLNRLRLIPTADYQPVPIVPAHCPVDGAPLDMSFAALRSVSPVHLEYMRNMGTVASMSISIVVDDRLWGLISCHHAAERHIDPQLRAACDFLGRLVAQQIDARERAAEDKERLRLKQVETELVTHLARAPTFQSGLVERASHWLGLVNADGAAVITDGIALTAGSTPPIDAILRLAEWMHERRLDQLYATDCLSAQWTEGAAFTDVASGVVAVPISRIHASFIMWFRPEIIRTVTWGGDPAAKVSAETGRLHPRASFASWTEQVRGRSRPWREAERLSAVDFRTAAVDFVLKRAEERAQLTEELQRSNRELEAFSYSISHDLRAPFRHIAGYAELLAEEEPELKHISRHYLKGISHAALSAGQLVDDLLHFSQLGRADLRISRIDMRKVADEVRRSLDLESQERPISWDIGPLPDCWGDPSLVRQALFNLAENAVKYTRKQPETRIRITGIERSADVLYAVEDNGIGFDMAYASKLFQVFQRLHRPEDYEGTGIGLALTRRIVERHGGTIEARGTVGQGATFSFSLPRRPEA
ncbi:ATP-binding protein [Chelatococcus reniformis]|uniref:histidine kinase n=1 Tax=Chelatococcus reniformis TaxID=1494448 RepID=A0A916X767_9HYPH|nr:ATP-binding protein [Chelatococcus reniformis]GGC49510.1 histidine kinase [Chelatococcus reniformis]